MQVHRVKYLAYAPILSISTISQYLVSGGFGVSVDPFPTEPDDKLVNYCAADVSTFPDLR